MAMRVLRNRTQRQKLVGEFRSSGLGHHAFCRLNGIVPSTLETWLREFAEASSFVPVRIEPSSMPQREECGGGRAGGARLFGTRGAVLEFAPGADASWVAEICGRLL
jgi:hypothetical protein